MKKLFLAALLASAAAPAMAQDTNQSGSQSNSDAVSGSQSGASSDNFNVNAGGNNAGMGNSASNSNSDAVSGSISGSESNGNQQGQDQGQSQGQSANNSQGQGQTSTNTLGQSAQQGNQQGVTVNQTWNSNQRRFTKQEFRTNAAVPLAASSSFSSDYCGGTASGGASAAPLGISIGGAAPVFDKSCQSLRRAEKFGMIAANYHNLGQPELALRAMSMMVWSVCTSDSKGPKADETTAHACYQAMMLGSEATPPQQHAVTPAETQKPNITPATPPAEPITGELGAVTSSNNPIFAASSPPRP